MTEATLVLRFRGGVNILCSKESGLESAVSCTCTIIDILFGMYEAKKRD